MKVKQNKEEWDFYMLTVDSTIASMYLDLGLKRIAPILEKENLFWISIKMNNPREDGLSSQEESKRLWEIEDMIVEQIATRHDIVYVGRMTSKGYRNLYFYFGEEMLIEKTLSSCMEQYSNYEYDFGIKSSDKWNSYLNFIYPSPKLYQSMMNRRVLDYMEEQGDNLEEEREVAHWIHFKSEKERRAYELEVKEKGYKIKRKDLDSTNEEFKYQQVISREDKVNRNEIDKYTIGLWELANKLNGDYNGWEARIINEKE